jgi:uncharacterized coiled-coil protein SlyX
MASAEQRIQALEAQVAQLQQIVAQLCEQAAEEDDETEQDLEGNVIVRAVDNTERYCGL